MKDDTDDMRSFVVLPLFSLVPGDSAICCVKNLVATSQGEAGTESLKARKQTQIQAPRLESILDDPQKLWYTTVM